MTIIKLIPYAIKPTNAYKRIQLLHNIYLYILYILTLLHVSATLVAILTEGHYEGYTRSTKVFEPTPKRKVLRFKM
jgi:hypothetical protein